MYNIMPVYYSYLMYDENPMVYAEISSYWTISIAIDMSMLNYIYIATSHGIVHIQK